MRGKVAKKLRKESIANDGSINRPMYQTLKKIFKRAPRTSRNFLLQPAKQARKTAN